MIDGFLTFEEMQEIKKKARAKNKSFDEQCTQAIKFIQENNIKTIERSDKNAKKTTTRK
jgi:hypothetical protein